VLVIRYATGKRSPPSRTPIHVLVHIRITTRQRLHHHHVTTSCDVYYIVVFRTCHGDRTMYYNTCKSYVQIRRTHNKCPVFKHDYETTNQTDVLSFIVVQNLCFLTTIIQSSSMNYEETRTFLVHAPYTIFMITTLNWDSRYQYRLAEYRSIWQHVDTVHVIS